MIVFILTVTFELVVVVVWEVVRATPGGKLLVSFSNRVKLESRGRLWSLLIIPGERLGAPDQNL
jgi:hypothetical protein